jgi:hypothetical protein
MAQVRIVYPFENDPLRPAKLTRHNVFVASGKAGQNVNHITGTCQLQGSPNLSRGVNTACIENCHGKGGDAKHLWMMMFRIDDPQEGRPYTLAIGARNKKNEPLDPVTITFYVKKRPVDDAKDSIESLAVPPGSGRSPRLIGIGWPGANETISGNPEGFAPYGDLFDHPLTSVALIPVNSGTEDPDNAYSPVYSFGDYTDLNCWYAQFTTIPAPSGTNTYTLWVFDSDDHSDSVEGLK